VSAARAAPAAPTTSADASIHAPICRALPLLDIVPSDYVAELADRRLCGAEGGLSEEFLASHYAQNEC
jgi:hypothetical protein